MTRRDEIVLDDLAHPRFPADVGELMAAGATMAEACPLTEAGVLDAARAQTGLDDFGDDDFREPLSVLLGCMRDEAGLSAFGTVTVHTQLVALARNRLLLQDLLAQHPEIHDIDVRSPIIIAGLPRSGTTNLHNLLAADPALRSLPYWEALEPVPDRSEADGCTVAGGADDPRRARTQVAVDFADAALPHLGAMHEMTADHVHEEIHLLSMDFSSMFFDTMAPMPSWRAFFRQRSQVPHYRYLRTVLRALTFLRGGERWVLKTPQHLEQLTTLMEVFPDATVVITHRDPVSVTTSMVTLLAYTARLQQTDVDLVGLAAHWAPVIEDMLATCVRTREVVPPEQSVDLPLERFLADPDAAVARVYDVAGQPLDAGARAAHRRYRDEHPQGRHGSVRYDPAPFGLDPAERRRALAGYTRRFDLQEET